MNVATLSVVTPSATLRAAASFTGFGKEKKLFTQLLY
jgi:hypothetical protein